VTVYIDVQLIEGLALPYVSGAEQALPDLDVNPVFADAWWTMLQSFPTATLEPLFTSLPVEALADMVDVIRMNGEEPPNPFSWFCVPSEDDVVDVLETTLQALPLFEYAGRRTAKVPAWIGFSTNPLTVGGHQYGRAPLGTGQTSAWGYDGGTGRGVRIADIEHGWNLNHEELLSADAHKTSAFGAPSADFIDHGTAVAGILVAADNGVGMVGLLPDASLSLVTDERRDGWDNTADAINAAAFTVGVGGVVLVELCTMYRNYPEGKEQADLPVETDVAARAAMRFVTLMGVTVIEPGGNGTIDLDKDPGLDALRPGSSSFVDSRAIVVGPGRIDAAYEWHPSNFATVGARVDCFADGEDIIAPSSRAANAYQHFSGTSAASPVIAAAAGALQGMVMAATDPPMVLAPADIRRLFRDPMLTTHTVIPALDRIGGMPDMPRVIASLGFPRRPIHLAAASSAGNGVVMAFIDYDGHLIRRHWTTLTGWGRALPAPDAAKNVLLGGGAPAVLSTVEPGAPDRLVHEVMLFGQSGVHYLAWDSAGYTSDISMSIAAVRAYARSYQLAVVRAAPDRDLIAGVTPEGGLDVRTGDPALLPNAELGDPVTISGIGRYRRTPGPALVSRGAYLADIVAIEDGGTLNWFSGNLIQPMWGTGWQRAVTEPSLHPFNSAVHPALTVLDTALLACALDTDGHLCTVEIDPTDWPDGISDAQPLDLGAAPAPYGPIALVSTAELVIVMAVANDGTLRAATRPRDGGDFTALPALPCDVALSLRGGVTAVHVPDAGVMALVVDDTGNVRFALSPDGQIWPPLIQIDWRHGLPVL
jgi:hypothetical protein